MSHVSVDMMEKRQQTRHVHTLGSSPVTSETAGLTLGNIYQSLKYLYPPPFKVCVEFDFGTQDQHKNLIDE